MPTPVNSTYETKPIPLLYDYNARTVPNPNLVDSVMVNMVPEVVRNQITGENEIHIIKRDGGKQVIASTGTGVVRGMFFWKDYSKIFICIGQDCYVYSDTYVLITTLVNIVPAGTSAVGFTDFLYSTGIATVLITDGTVLSEISATNIVTVCVDPDLPVPHLPTPKYYDGYLLLVKSTTGDCYNSDLDAPLVWTPGNFITAEIRPDNVSGIAVLNNYFVLFGSQSIEYFYNAGNPTGTPFARNDVFVKLTGLVSTTVSAYGNKLYVVGAKTESIADVYELEDFKLVPIGNPAIRRWLAQALQGVIVGAIISMNGQDFYAINDTDKTYYVALETKLWSQLKWKTTSDFRLTSQTVLTGGFGQNTIFSTDTDNSICVFDPLTYQDNGVTFPCTLQTNTINYGTNNNKFMSCLTFWADRWDGYSNVGSIDIQYTDDDFKTYSTARTLDLNHERPNLQQWGRFRQRAFKYTYTQNAPLRLKYVETDINMGVS